MQDDLNDMAYFAAVVQHQGFTAAGRAIGVSKSVLSRRIEALELRLGVRLLNRTSRHFSVTDVGVRYAQECRKLLEQAQAARQVIDQAREFPQGFLRVSSPVMMAETILAPIVSRFLLQYPQVTIEVLAVNRNVDLLDENIDIGVLSHQQPLENSSLYRRPLGTMRNSLVASPDFLRGCRSSPTIDNLSQLPTLTRHTPSGSSLWQLTHPLHGTRQIQVQSRLRSNNLLVLKQGAIDGLGIALLPEEVCEECLKTGSLQRVLEEWHTTPSFISALYSNKKGQTSALRALLDHLSQSLGGVEE